MRPMATLVISALLTGAYWVVALSGAESPPTVIYITAMYLLVLAHIHWIRNHNG